MVLEFCVSQREQPRDRHARSEQQNKPPHPDDFPLPDDSHWDVFIPDDDELDPLPEPGDYWIEPEDERGAGSVEQGAIDAREILIVLVHPF